MEAAFETTVKKREIKANEKKESQEVPLKINYYKFAIEDIKDVVLDFSRIKLGSHGDDSIEYLVLEAIIRKCENNLTSNGKQFHETASK